MIVLKRGACVSVCVSLSACWVDCCTQQIAGNMRLHSVAFVHQFTRVLVGVGHLTLRLLVDERVLVGSRL